jgi:hypothetical protein
MSTISSSIGKPKIQPSEIEFQLFKAPCVDEMGSGLYGPIKIIIDLLELNCYAFSETLYIPWRTNR